MKETGSDGGGRVVVGGALWGARRGGGGEWSGNLGEVFSSIVLRGGEEGGVSIESGERGYYRGGQRLESGQGGEGSLCGGRAEKVSQSLRARGEA